MVQGAAVGQADSVEQKWGLWFTTTMTIPSFALSLIGPFSAVRATCHDMILDE
jgi:hypothetical protein